MKANQILREEVAKVFELAPHITTARWVFGPKIGKVDFSTLTLQEAEALHKRGLVVLIRKPAPAQRPQRKKSEKKKDRDGNPQPTD